MRRVTPTCWHSGDYFSGDFTDSDARGQRFGYDQKTGDARISGSLASLVGLEVALEQQDQEKIDHAIGRILLLHSMIMSFGGIPLIYYGDETGTLNDYSYLEDEARKNDNRWMHRPRIDWEKVEKRHQQGTVEQRIFDGLKKMIAARKTIPAFSDYNNRQLIETGNSHLLAFWRTHPEQHKASVLVVGNFDATPQSLDLSILGNQGLFLYGNVRDINTGETPALYKEQLVIPPYRFYWLTEK